MSDLTVALIESLVGMVITLALLGALAVIFQLIGKYEVVAKRKSSTAAAIMTKQATPDDASPYIAAAIYLYMAKNRKSKNDAKDLE